MKERTWLEGAGWGVLLTLRVTAHLLSPYNQKLYLYLLPLSSVYLGALFDLIAVSLFAGLIWAIAVRLDGRSVLWVFALSGIVSLEIYDLAVLCSWIPPYRMLAGLFAAVALVGLGLRELRLGWFKVALRMVQGSLAVAGFSVLFIAPWLGYFAAISWKHETPFFSTKSRMSQGQASSRIVWVIFDELSYYQTYEHRWTGLSLPNFDRLRAESITFTNVRPVGNYTENVIPSLFLGRPVSKVRRSADGGLDVYFDNELQWRRFDASQTVFADAQRLGWSNGIAGWYMPYCRMMTGWTDSCYWSFQNPLEENVSPRQDVLRNFTAPFMTWLHRLMPAVVDDRYSVEMNLVRAHQRDYSAVMERAQALLRDPSVRFAYIHLDVPHLPAIYNRRAQRFSRGGSYLDNLALADQALGQLLDTMEGQPDWSSTTLIVMGDHSWRTYLGRDSPGLSPEDAVAATGGFDPRPVLSVHLAAERGGSVVNQQVPALALHDMLEGLLRGQIRAPNDLVRLGSPALDSTRNILRRLPLQAAK